jgi:hypothetical protein
VDDRTNRVRQMRDLLGQMPQHLPDNAIRISLRRRANALDFERAHRETIRHSVPVRAEDANRALPSFRNRPAVAVI